MTAFRLSSKNDDRPVFLFPNMASQRPLILFATWRGNALGKILIITPAMSHEALATAMSVRAGCCCGDPG